LSLIYSCRVSKLLFPAENETNNTATCRVTIVGTETGRGRCSAGWRRHCSSHISDFYDKQWFPSLLRWISYGLVTLCQNFTFTPSTVNLCFVSVCPAPIVSSPSNVNITIIYSVIFPNRSYPSISKGGQPKKWLLLWQLILYF
jgi:hypothetical protein